MGERFAIGGMYFNFFSGLKTKNLPYVQKGNLTPPLNCIILRLPETVANGRSLRERRSSNCGSPHNSIVQPSVPSKPHVPPRAHAERNMAGHVRRNTKTSPDSFFFPFLQSKAIDLFSFRLLYPSIALGG